MIYVILTCLISLYTLYRFHREYLLDCLGFRGLRPSMGVLYFYMIFDRHRIQ